MRPWQGPRGLSRLHVGGVLVGLGALGYLGLWWARDLVFKEIDPWPIVAMPLWVVGGIVVVLLAPRLQPVPIRWLAACGLLVSALMGFAGTRAQSSAMLSGHMPIASLLAERLGPLADFDGDGVSSWLGGGDCAPFDAQSFPGAVDFPDDGVDQDCFGGDLSSKLAGAAMVPEFAPVAEDQKAELVVLVSVDALRPDFLGFYGYRTYPSSPNLDRWAQGAAVFDNAFTSGPYTTIAVPSMLTGLGMNQIPGYVSNLFEERISTPTLKLPEQVHTLAEQMASLGYHTGAIVSGFDIRINRFDQGFKDVDVVTPRSFDTADKVTASARQWLAKNPTGKRFLWLHYFDPHDPYFDGIKPSFGSSTKARYANSIAFMDRHLGPLILELAEQPNTMVGLVSDHGESLGEKGRYGHGYNLHRHETRVVMAWRGRGVQPRRFNGAVSLVDVTPTMVNSVGGKAKQSAGLSLLSALRGGSDQLDRAVLTESYRRGHHFAVNTAQWRLFYHIDQNRFELYDQRLDPLEKVDRALDRPAELKRLKERLMTLMNQGGAFVRQGEQARALLVDAVPETARLPKPVRFGDAIELVGYEFGQGGEANKPQHVATVYLRALRRMKRSWKVAFGMRGPRPMNKDHFPGRSYYPTDRWPPGAIIKDPVILGTMSKFPTADWSLTLGFYNGKHRLKPQEGGGLALTTAGTRVVLADKQRIKPMAWALERDRKQRAQKKKMQRKKEQP